MIYLLIIFLCGAICGGCFGALVTAIVANANNRTLPQWSDYFDNR